MDAYNRLRSNSSMGERLLRPKDRSKQPVEHNRYHVLGPLLAIQMRRYQQWQEG